MLPCVAGAGDVEGGVVDMGMHLWTELGRRMQHGDASISRVTGKITLGQAVVEVMITTASPPTFSGSSLRRHPPHLSVQPLCYHPIPILLCIVAA